MKLRTEQLIKYYGSRQVVNLHGTYAQVVCLNCGLTMTREALADELAVAPPDVPPDRLRAALRAQHAELDWPRPAELTNYLLDE